MDGQGRVTQDEYHGALDRRDKQISELKAAMLEATYLLGGLSMATEGHLRGRICSVSNRLNHALGRTLSSHGDQPCKACGKFGECICETA